MAAECNAPSLSVFTASVNDGLELVFECEQTQTPIAYCSSTAEV